MSDVTFYFFMHVLLMLYGEAVEQRMKQEKRELSPEFWGFGIDLTSETFVCSVHASTLLFVRTFAL